MFKRTLAGVAVAAIMLTQVGTVLAKFSDVPAGVWYESAVQSFTDAGYLDATQPRFRGGDSASRAEFVKLLVMTQGGLLSTPPAVPSFNDVPTGAWYYSYMEEAGKEGWVSGDGACYGKKPCYARPLDNVNRAEAAKLVVQAFALESTGAAPQFVDNPSGQWYTSVVQTAADHCVLQGDPSGTVRPGDKLNRAEMVVMLNRADQGLKFGVDCGKNVVTKPSVKAAVSTDSVKVEVEFTVAVKKDSAETIANYTVGTPAISVTAAKLIANNTVELTLGQDTVADKAYTVEVKNVAASADGTLIAGTVSFKGYTAIVKGNGDLEVSIASKSPKGDTVPRGAIGVVMLATDFTSSCTDSVSVSNVTVLHEGFGPVADVDGVYLSVNGARVSRKRTIDSQSQAAELRFSSPLVIAKCETVTVDVVADFNSTATISAKHNFVVELPTDVTSNAQKVTGNFPLRGETFDVAAVTSGIITVSYHSVNPNQVKVGDKGAIVGKFEVAANSTEDQTVYSVTLQQNGSASDGDIANIAVRRTDGTVLTNTVAQTVGNFVTLVFDPPFTVLEGDRITLEVVADIANGADKNVQLHFEESSDLFAVGSLYGYGVNGQLYGSQIAIPNDNATTVSIDAGQFTIGINGPSQAQYTSSTKGAVLANVSFATGGDDVNVRDLYIAIQGQTSSGYYMCASGGANATGCATPDTIVNMLESVQLRNSKTGQTISGVRQTTAATDYGQSPLTNKGIYQVYRFDDFVIHGQQDWVLSVSFISNSGGHPGNGDKFTAYICGEPTNVLDTNTPPSLTTNDAGCNFGGILSSTATTSTTSPDAATVSLTPPAPLAVHYQMKVEGLSTGDKIGDVRPRGTIVGLSQQVVDASLTVQTNNLKTRDSAVKNTPDIALLQFETKASAAEDVLITKVVFDAQSGSLLNATNYTLWVDTNNDRKVDSVLQSGAAPTSGAAGTVSFSQMLSGGALIKKSQSAVFEVHAQVASSFQTNAGLMLRFATGQTNYIEAIKMSNGASLSGLKLNGFCGVTKCDITITAPTNSKLGTNWGFLNSGNLFVTADLGTSYSARQILAGTLSEPLLRLKFYADREDIDVSDLVLNSSGSNADTIGALELWPVGATDKLVSSTSCGTDDVLTTNVGAGVTTTSAFCFSGMKKQLVVKRSSPLYVDVRARINSNDGSNGVSAQIIALFLDATPTATKGTSGSGSVRGSGVGTAADLKGNVVHDGSGIAYIGTETITAANSRIVSKFNTTVLSKFASVTNGMAAIDSSLHATDSEPLGSFTFTVMSNLNAGDGGSNSEMKSIVFGVSSTNVTIDGSTFRLLNSTSGSSNTFACTPYKNDGTTAIGTASGSFVVVCPSISGITTQMNMNSATTFTLLAKVLNANTSTNGQGSLTVSISNFNDPVKAYGTASTAGHIQWIDHNASGIVFNWIDYPIGTGTVNSLTKTNG
ncbi:MAG: S-layer homology domain-containing protein [Candidatus Peregrinibacteria bacterium]